jgi:hypothetical protein
MTARTHWQHVTFRAKMRLSHPCPALFHGPLLSARIDN